MPDQIKNLIAFLSNFIPLPFLISGKKYPPFLPFYHTVSDTKREYITSYVVRSQRLFENELDYLLKHYTPVDLETIFSTPQKGTMHLSFDDGLKECSTVIAPILKRKGIPATFFISSDFVDNKALFHRFKQAILEEKGLLTSTGKKIYFDKSAILDEIAEKKGVSFEQYLIEHQPYMSMGEIMKLQDDGFTIGSHSINHPEFWTLTEEEQYHQIAESMDWIVSTFTPKIKAFSFPFTDNGVSSSLFKKLEANRVVDITFGSAGLKYDQIPFNLQRIPIERKQNWSARKTVHFEYLYYFTRALLGANTVKR